MKVLRFVLVLAIALAAFGMFPGSANAQQFPSYTSGINVQNLGADTANISIEFYNAGTAAGGGGTVAAAPVSDTVAGFGVKNYFPLTAVASGFKGSVVIASDQPLAAVTNVATSTMTVLGAYNGASTGSTTVFLPILHKGNGGFTSWYSIQNAGSVAAQVTVDYSSTAATNDVSLTIAPSASVTVYQKDEAMHGTVKLFAGTVTSTNGQPLVVVAMQENVGNILAYTGFNAGSKTPVMPTINMNNSGYITGTQIYNLSGANTDVTVSYKTGGQFGTDCTETKTIPAKSMVVFTSGAFGPTTQAGENCVNGQRFLGSASVTANTGNADLAVVVNQLRTAPSVSNGASYNAFDPSKANSTVFMPTIFDRNSGWYTAFNVMNVGTGSTFVRCTFANSSVRMDTGELAAGASKTLSQLNAIGDRYIGSAICKAYTNSSYTTENTSAKILTVVNQLGPGGPDNLLSYEGINP